MRCISVHSELCFNSVVVINFFQKKKLSYNFDTFFTTACLYLLVQIFLLKIARKCQNCESQFCKLLLHFFPMAETSLYIYIYIYIYILGMGILSKSNIR